MNLLSDPWVPVEDAGKTRLITLKEILCEDHDHHIVLPRDDLELACLQLLICLTQALFPPANKNALRTRLRHPMSADEYTEGSQPFIDWFDLRHEKYPFMQVRGVKAKKDTPVQKLFPGLPAGDGSHTFFVERSEITSISEPIAAIALFNQASNAPSFGGGNRGGFKYGLRGVPITTFIHQKSLRHTIWSNILHIATIQSSVTPEYCGPSTNDKPTWVDLIKEKAEISASDIGLIRGLFWQPAHIELSFSENHAICDCLGISVNEPVESFLTEQFGFKINGIWTHPHSPRDYDRKKKTPKYLSFNNTAPAWTQLDHLLVESQDKNKDYIPAEVVRQFKRDLKQSDQLIVGGYRNKQASILQRRHEFFPLRPGWDLQGDQIGQFVGLAMTIKSTLTSALLDFGKLKDEKKKVRVSTHKIAEDYFYRQSEPIIHQALQEIDWNDTTHPLAELRDRLIQLSWDIFEKVTQPYAHEPKMIHALADARARIKSAFRQLIGAQA